MFDLVIRDGANLNIGRANGIKSADEIALDLGHLVDVSDAGAVTAFAGTKAPYGIVTRSIPGGKTAAGDEVIVTKITTDMIFRASIKNGTSEQIKSLVPGAYIKCGADGVDASVDASAASTFCRIVDACDAKTIGDRILVSFEYEIKA